ncbi:hypothetical protein [Rhodoplanes sp. SY1]|uniref:hypothetical protein n=1 Tax=Rhodoplanes sp. SY1 TaxID=3166646 RepID=UPI0038B54802
MVQENFGVILALTLIIVPTVGALLMGNAGRSHTSYRPAFAGGRGRDDHDHDTDEGEPNRGHPVRDVGRNPDRR